MVIDFGLEEWSEIHKEISDMRSFLSDYHADGGEYVSDLMVVFLYELNRKLEEHGQ